MDNAEAAVSGISEFNWATQLTRDVELYQHARSMFRNAEWDSLDESVLSVALSHLHESCKRCVFWGGGMEQRYVVVLDDGTVLDDDAPF